MKKLVTAVETGETALESLLGDKVFVLCSGYFYRGKLVGINGDALALEGAEIVYDAQDFKKVGTTQALPNQEEWFVALSAIESFGKVG